MQAMHVARASDAEGLRAITRPGPESPQVRRRHTIGRMFDIGPQTARRRRSGGIEPISPFVANTLCMEREDHADGDLPVDDETVARSLPDLHVLARALDAIQEGTALHSERVARLAFAVALELGWPTERAQELAQAALLHDVGKVIVPDGVLMKAGPLSADEYDLVMGHAAAGARMVEGALTAEQTGWILHHHEHVDGGGYPDHAAELEIPEGSRILGLVDAFDVMTEGRPYQVPLALEAAIAECTVLAGRQFDARVVRALAGLLRPVSELPVPPRVSPVASHASSISA